MREIDRAAIQRCGIPGMVLMENAGRAAADWLEAELKGLTDARIAVVCGPGNNGGDGFVVARHLANRGAKPDCLLLGRVSQLKGDAAQNAKVLAAGGLEVMEVDDPDDLEFMLDGCEAIVDAVFGTGLDREPSMLFKQAFDAMNASDALILSIDVPSGVNSDTGETYSSAIQADMTVAMGLPKLGHMLYPGREHTGEMRVADIGIPTSVLNENADTWLLEPQDVVLPFRPGDGHKGTFGTVLVLAGSRGYSGAACLAARAAVRSGCGLVKVAVPAGICSTVESAVLEAVKFPLAQTETETLSSAAKDRIVELAAGCRCVAIGPGISTPPETRKLVLDLLPALELPVVIDADAINNLVGHLDVLSRRRAPTILTPHPGELARLTGMSATTVNSERVNTARRFTTEHGVILVLKGAPTLVAARDSQVFVNPSGNPGLGSGGTGDVLTGLLAGLIAQGMDPVKACQAAVYLHGLAADLAAAKLTEYCLSAGDLIEYLPHAFNKVVSHDEEPHPAPGP
jgi:ADP-dependent NAD(P)H-hydrate dehydratase / NAD(P)H-hydrate epimerase